MATATIEYPDELLVSLKESADEFSDELRIAAAVKLYELGKLSCGKAAKLAGIDTTSFLRTLGRFKVSISNADEFIEDSRHAID